MKDHNRWRLGAYVVFLVIIIIELAGGHENRHVGSLVIIASMMICTAAILKKISK